MRKQFRKHPDVIVQQYTQMCKNLLSVHTDTIPWEYKDVTLKLTRKFGKQRGLLRCHMMLFRILQLLMKKDVDHASAYTVQALKCLHQVALDGGKWDSAELFLPYDTTDLQAFAGNEGEMVSIHSYQKAMRELRSNHVVTPNFEQAPPASDLEEDGEPREGVPRLFPNAKQKAFQKKKEAAK